MDDNEEVNDNLPQESESVQQRSKSRNNMVNRKVKERMAKSVKLKAAKQTLIKALLPILTYVLIFLIILIIIIGIVLFFITMPGMVIEQIKELAKKVGNAVASWFGADTTQQVEDVEIYETLDYLEQMGYDLKGYGFLTDYVGDSDDGVERDDDGKISNAESQFISSYLVSDNYVYTIKNFNQKASNPIAAIGQHLASLFTLGQTNQFWSRGMIDIWLDGGVVGSRSQYYSVYNLGSINVDMEKKELEIKRGWFNNSMKYNLDGWTGRYGMPIDFLISVHLATMMPDLAYDLSTSFETVIDLMLHPIGGGTGDQNTAIGYYKIGDSYKSYDDFKEAATSGITGSLNSWRISKKEAKAIMDEFGIKSPENCMGTSGVGEDNVDSGTKTQKLDYGTMDVKCIGDSGYDDDDKGKENKKAVVDAYNEVMNTLKGYGLTNEIAEGEGLKLTISSFDEYKEMLEEKSEENQDSESAQYFYKEPSRSLTKQLTWQTDDDGYQSYTAELTLTYNNYSMSITSATVAGGGNTFNVFNNMSITYNIIGTWTQERIDEWMEQNNVDVPEEARCSQVDGEEVCSACRSYVQKIYDYLKKADVSNLEIYQPYIAKVTDHWYRDVYFVSDPGKEFVDYDYDYEAVMKERWTLYETYGSSNPDKEGEYKLYEINDDGTYKKNGDDYVLFDGTQEEASSAGKKVAKKAKMKKISDMSDDLNWQQVSGLLSAYKIEGVTQEDFQAVYPDVGEDDKDYEIKKNVFVAIRTTGNVTQMGEGQRTETNPKIKKMFLKNRYFKYDGSQETAEIITALRKSIDSEGYYGPVKGQNFSGDDVDYTKTTAEVDGKTYKVSDYSGEVSLNQDSLNAFSMLENEHTLDADYIYRDFKELAVELGYFEKEELTDETPRLLQFLIPEIGSGPSAGSETSSNVSGENIVAAADRVYEYCKKHGYIYENNKNASGLIDITREDGTSTIGTKSTNCSSFVAAILIEAGFYDKDAFIESNGKSCMPYAKDFWRFGKSGSEMGVKTTGSERNHKKMIEHMKQKCSEMELVQDSWDGKNDARHPGKIDKSKLKAGDILADAHNAISDVGGHVAIYDGNGKIYESSGGGVYHRDFSEDKFSRVLRVTGGVSGDGAGLSGFPNRAIDKNEHEYGTMIHSKGDIDANKANTLKSLIKDAIVTAATEESSDDSSQEGNTVNGISSEASQRLDETVSAITAQDNTDSLFVKVGVITSDDSSSSSSSSSSSNTSSSSSSLLSLEEWWEETQKMFDIYKSEGWVYSDHGAGTSKGCNANKTFEEAHDSGHHDVDCSIGASWMLQKLGALQGSKTFASGLGSGGTLSGECAQDLIDAGADAFVPKGSVDFTNAANNGELEPGDVLFYDGHVSIYCGDSWEGGGTTFCWDTGADKGIQGGGPRDDSWEDRPIKLIVRFPLGNSTKREGKPYEGYLGNEAVVSPVTGILLEYGTYDGKEKDSVTGEVYRTNIDLKYGTGLLKPTPENTGDENNTQTQNTVKTEGRTQVDKVGYAKILVLDKENYKKIEQKLLSESRWSDSFLSSNGKYRDINDLTEKQITDKNNPWTDIDKTLYGYKEFAESYENYGIAGNVIYIEGFKAEMPDEEFDIEADAETKSPKGEEIKISDFEKVTMNNFSGGKISDSEDLLESLYEKDKDYKLASKKATEKLKAENILKETAISSLYVNGLKVIKEGTIIGRTITDRELIVDYREENYEDYRTPSDASNDDSASEDSSNNSISDTTESKDKVIGNYLRIIMRDLDKTVVENVEDYMKLDDVGEEEEKGLDTKFPEVFLFWLGVLEEGACEGKYDQGDYYGYEVLADNAGNTTAFGLTASVAGQGKIPEMYPDFEKHVKEGKVPKKEAQDVFVLALEAAREYIIGEDGSGGKITDTTKLSEPELDALCDLYHASPSECQQVCEIYNSSKNLTVADFENHWGTNTNYEKQLKSRAHCRGILATEERYLLYNANEKECEFLSETPWTEFCGGTPSTQLYKLK